VVIVDLWIFTTNEINIMKKKLGPISVVLDCFCVSCVCQISSKRGGEPIIDTRCRRFAIEEPQHHKYTYEVSDFSLSLHAPSLGDLET
jgi:hypothetical protein